MSEPLATYNRDYNITGDVSGYLFVPEYGSTVKMSVENSHFYTADRFYKKISKGLNTTTTNLQLLFLNKEESYVKSFLKMLESVNDAPLGSLDFGEIGFKVSGVKQAFIENQNSFDGLYTPSGDQYVHEVFPEFKFEVLDDLWKLIDSDTSTIYYSEDVSGIGHQKFPWEIENWTKEDSVTDPASTSPIFEYQSAIDFPEEGIYKNMKGFLVDNYDFKFHHQMVDITLNLVKNGYSSLMDWQTSSYLNVDNFVSNWEEGKNYKKFDVVYNTDYTSVSGQLIDKNDHYYYCKEDHISSTGNAPISDEPSWSRNFLFEPDDETSIATDRSSEIIKLSNSFYSFSKTDANVGLIQDLKLSFKGRSDREANSIIHFFEKHENYKPFEYKLPQLYTGQKIFVLKSLNHRLVYKDSNDIEVTMDEIIKFKATTDAYIIPVEEPEEPIEIYVLSTNKGIVSEGENFSITLYVENVESLSIPYSIEGVSSNDINGAPLLGYFQIDENGFSTIDYQASLDSNKESQEILKLSLGNGVERSISIVINNTEPAFELESSKHTVNEGDNFTVELIATNFLDGPLPYTITGIDELDIEEDLRGSFNVTSGSALATFSIRNDFRTDGLKTFKLKLDDYPESQELNVQILDTSVAPSFDLFTTSGDSVNEGEPIYIVLKSTEYPPNLEVAYTIEGVSESDIEEDLTGLITTYDNVGVAVFHVRSDLLTESEAPEVFELYLTDFPENRVTININDTSQDPDFVLSRSSSSANEGSKFSIFLDALGVSNQAIPYTIGGSINSADIEEDLTGVFNFFNGHAEAEFNVVDDFTSEGSELFTLQLADYPEKTISVTINDTSQDPDFVLSRSSSSANEGSEFSIFLDGPGIPNQAVPYTIGGSINSADIEEDLTGVFNFFNGHAEAKFNVVNDYTSEGSELFTLQLDNYPEKTISVTINDTSKDATFELSGPTTASENAPFTVVLTTTSFPNLPVPYTIGGTISEDDIAEDFFGEFYVVNGHAQVTFNVSDDWTQEGEETFVLSLDNGADDISIAIQDTSNTYPDWVPQPKQEFGIHARLNPLGALYPTIKQEFGIHARLNLLGALFPNVKQEFGIHARLNPLGAEYAEIHQEFGIHARMAGPEDAELTIETWLLNLLVDSSSDVYIEMSPVEGYDTMFPSLTLDIEKHLIRVSSPTSTTSTLHFEGNSLVNVNGFSGQELSFFYTFDQGLYKAAKFNSGDVIDATTSYDLISTTHVIVVNEDDFFNGFVPDQAQYVGFKLILNSDVYYGWIKFIINSDNHDATISRISLLPESTPLTIPN